ncbi:hypothetical protein M427DRAFT_345071 [Gonapodya prolifera JEL478]|uniref:Uncharacterized protein n=1 Tax=Gonapodya prolifera (strain JEL478) TaxID=1344416 RepID=A0A139AVN0_GONPJ|nr:hypothetical protein M427DRAFT_345071 [Gonapodya prolifera JEL478]|eukprot:KXS20786.1 hypothetical protein M427DRAFT_345071 [Gonapodya prolifera JEL478]
MNAFLVQPTGGHQPSQSPTPTTVHLSPRLSEDATGSAYSSPPGEQDPMGISSTEGMSQFFDFGLSSTREDQSPKADFRQITGADGVTQTARSEMTLMSETFGSSDSGLAEVHITHGKKLPPLPGSISSRSLGSADYSPSRKRRAEELGTAAELRPGKISRSITGLRG